MKNIHYLYLVLLLLVLSGGCTSDQELGYVEMQDATSLTIDEAKGFFEQIVQLSTERSVTCLSESTLSPGEYVPQWNRATTSFTGDLRCLWIPIDAQYRFRALQSKFENSSAHAYEVNLEQQLMVQKNDKTGKLSTLIVTFIPDKGYDEAGKGNMAKFQGITIGHSVYSGRMLMVAKYEKGIKTQSVFIGNDRSVFAARMAEANRMLQNMKVLRSSRVITRMDGEESFACPMCFGGGCTACGDVGDGGSSEEDENWPGNFCSFCGGSGCDFCGNDGRFEDPNWYPSEQDPGDPIDPDYNPGYGEGSGTWWVRCRPCGRYLGDVAPGDTQFFHCSGCGSEFYYTAPY